MMPDSMVDQLNLKLNACHLGATNTMHNYALYVSKQFWSQGIYMSVSDITGRIHPTMLTSGSSNAS